MVDARAGVALFAAALALAPGAAAQDLARGKLLYETHCYECHYERIHQRIRSDVKDLDDLRDIVWQRSRETKKRSFTADELNDIVEYLNASHYRFGLGAPKR